MADEWDQSAIFDLLPQWVQPRLGRSALRARRQRFLISLGLHPLSLVLRRELKLADNGATCGSCLYLGKLDWVPPAAPNPSPLKCWRYLGSRVSRGEATTVRRWWPACVDYEGDDRDDSSQLTPPGEAAG